MAIFLYLGAIYEEGAVQVVEVGVLDNDKSPFSQQIIDNIQASPKIKVIKIFSSENRLEDIFVSQPEIKGVYYIPENFSKNVMLGKQQQLIVYTNSSNIIYGNLLYKEAATFINTLSAKITLSSLTLKGVPYEKAIKMVMPVKTQTRALFNPYYNYLYYLSTLEFVMYDNRGMHDQSLLIADEIIKFADSTQDVFKQFTAVKGKARLFYR